MSFESLREGLYTSRSFLTHAEIMNHVFSITFCSASANDPAVSPVFGGGPQLTKVVGATGAAGDQ